MNAHEIKAEVASYFRYKRQCSIVAFETPNNCKWYDGEPADVLAVDDRRMLYEIEVKISMADFRHDATKTKHRLFTNDPTFRPVNYFYFAVPTEIANQVEEECRILYPYAGVIRVHKISESTAGISGASVTKSPKMLNNNRLALKEIAWLVNAQSGTLCRLARENVKLKAVLKVMEGKE
jgi:hypothetical protein